MNANPSLPRALVVGMLLVLVVAALPTARAGTTISAPPVQWVGAPTNDAWIDQANPNANNNGISLQVKGTVGGTAQYSFLKWDVSKVPSNVQVLSCIVSLYVSTVSTDKFNIASTNWQQVTGAWSEGTITWNTAPLVSGANYWQGQITNASVFTVITGTITNLCAGWIAGSTANNGIRVGISFYSVSGTPTASFPSKDNGAPVAGQPIMTVSYLPPTATVFTSFFCSGGPCEGQVASGSGLPAYLFSVFFSEANGTLHQSPRPDIILTNISTWLRVVVRDFWGNSLYDHGRMMNNVTNLWSIGINYALLNSYNMRDAYTNLTVTPGSGTPMIIFLPPRGWYTFPLHVGTVYFLNYTLYNGNFGILGYINLTRTMPSYGLNYLVNGTSITEVRQVQSGEWLTGNTTQGLAGAIGNIMLMPHGIDLFKSYYQLNLGGFAVPLTPWIVLVSLTVAGWVGWVYYYWPPREGRLRGTHVGLRLGIRRWPRGAKLWFGLFLFPLSFFLAVFLIVHLSGGSVFVPVPWIPLGGR